MHCSLLTTQVIRADEGQMLEKIVGTGMHEQKDMRSRAYIATLKIRRG
jgi:hypothetical protein